jgi:hypothetical protein
MSLRLPIVNKTIDHFVERGTMLYQATSNGNFRVLASLLGPAYRGLIQKRGKNEAATSLNIGYPAQFDWEYKRDHQEIRRLTEAAKASQWNASTDLDWSVSVDPFDPDACLLPESFHPASWLPMWTRLSDKERKTQMHALVSWLLSQFLHGEQGALFAAALTTTAVPWLDAKLYGGTQVMDEARHVEAFHTYLTAKLEKLYQINENLYVVIDALMTDSRWDVKFLGMQIMIEGLALGAFTTIRSLTREPLLKDLLRLVITDEARHVHYGVLSLGEFYVKELSERERRDREDWAFEMSLLLRNRFLLHEFYEEFYAHCMPRSQWNRLILHSDVMAMFRKTMFKRIIPNLKRIGLLSARIRPHYAQLGLLAFENGKTAPELTADELLNDEP